MKEGTHETSHTTETISLGIVEDQFLFRKGITAILSNWTNLNVCFEASEGYSVINSLNQLSKVPDVMLVDLSLPPNGNVEYSGLNLTTDLRNHYPEIKILILSAHEEDSFIAELIKYGAHGYLIKDSNPQEVYEAIVSVHVKGMYINERTLKAIQNNSYKKKPSKPSSYTGNNVQLTKREEEILMLICGQKTTDEIAEELFISPKTVNGHRNNLLQKTGSRNVAGLVAFALTRN